MPIKDLSVIRRFPRGGKVRLGTKKKSPRTGGEYPAKLDYFLFDPIDAYAHLMPTIMELYGEKPKTLRVVFPSEDLEVVFPQYYKLYTASGLKCKGDGEIAERAVDGEMHEVTCPGPENCEWADSHGAKACKRVANLQFILPNLPTLATWQIDTSSWNSIVNVNSGLDMLRRVAGRISFVPVDLLLVPHESQGPDGKSHLSYVLQLSLPVSLANIGQLKPLVADNRAALPPSERVPDDLYPTSQIGLPAPQTAEVQQVENGSFVNSATGEIVDPPADEPEPEPEVPDFEHDPDVVAACAGIAPAKAKAIIASAITGKWTRDELLACLAKHAPASAPQPAPQPPESKPATPAKPGTLF